MSIKLMSRIWECELDHPEQSVLLALADHADDEGGHVRPSMEYIAWKTGYSERQVRRVVGALKLKMVLLVVRVGHRSPNEYRINLAPLVFKQPFVRARDMTPAFRAEIIARDGHVCSYCKKPGDDTFGPDSQLWHVDRIVPASKGGTYEESNVTLSCGTCNRSKGAKMAPLTAEVRVPSNASSGAISSSSGAIVKTGDPSVEPSVEPPLTRARGNGHAGKTEPAAASSVAVSETTKRVARRPPRLKALNGNGRRPPEPAKTALAPGWRPSEDAVSFIRRKCPDVDPDLIVIAWRENRISAGTVSADWNANLVSYAANTQMGIEERRNRFARTS